MIINDLRRRNRASTCVRHRLGCLIKPRLQPGWLHCATQHGRAQYGKVAEGCKRRIREEFGVLERRNGMQKSGGPASAPTVRLPRGHYRRRWRVTSLRAGGSCWWCLESRHAGRCRYRLWQPGLLFVRSHGLQPSEPRADANAASRATSRVANRPSCGRKRRCFGNPARNPQCYCLTGRGR